MLGIAFINAKCDFYCLSYKNLERKAAMENRFKNLGIDAFMYEGVGFDDERIVGRDVDEHTKRCWSFTYGHFDLIREFYFNSEKEYGIFSYSGIISAYFFLFLAKSCVTATSNLPRDSNISDISLTIKVSESK